ncbi:MAG: nucleoside monophosphate kinase [Caldisericota bacterium]|jgi:adenylate kinase|nr:nucleoside monophosphate kinase [Caldisericota bacterium]
MVEHPRIVLLGLPGSGKGTQAAFMTKAWGVPAFSSGEYFRNLRRAGALSAEIAAKISAGGLVSDEDVSAIVVEAFLSTQRAQAGFVLDGYPRTVAQAAFLDEYLSKQSLGLSAVIYIDLPEEVAFKRIAGRRICPQDGDVYNVHYSPSSREGFCDRCGSALVQRDDDREESVSVRMRKYDEVTKVLTGYYARRHILISVDGSLTPDDVFCRIAQELDDKA